MSAIYFCMQIDSYNISYFLPTIIGEFGFDHLMSNLLTAPIYILAMIGVLLTGLNADRIGKHLLHVICWLLVGTVGFFLLAFSLEGDNLGLQYTAAGLATAAQHSIKPPFLAYTTISMKSSTSVAVATAAVIGVGNLAGYVGPQFMAYSKAELGTYSIGLYVGAGFMFLAVIGCVLLGFWNKDFSRDKKNYQELEG